MNTAPNTSCNILDRLQPFPACYVYAAVSLHRFHKYRSWEINTAAVVHQEASDDVSRINSRAKIAIIGHERCARNEALLAAR